MGLNYDNCTTDEAVAKLLREYQQHVLEAKTLPQLLRLVTTDKLAQDIAQLAEHFWKRGKEQGGVTGYDALVTALGEVPNTWLPALLVCVVQVCVRQKVFVAGGLERMVKKAIAQEEAKPDLPIVTTVKTGRSKSGSKFSSTVKPGDAIECDCGNGHTWRTTAVEYCGESWQPRKTRCHECGGVYLVAKQVLS